MTQQEKNAKAAHDIWAHWMKYMFTLCPELTDYKGDKNGNFVILKPQADRWKRLMNTPFEDLTDKEKASDFEVAAMFLD